jgi:putative drug exporter of the RND superfamily
VTTLRASRTPPSGAANKITSLPSGRRSKFAVLASWIIALGVTWPHSSVGAFVAIFAGAGASLLFSTLAVVVVVMLLIYRSPLLWLVPVTSAGAALAIAHAALGPLTRNGLSMTGQSWEILVVLVLGTSTGYALLLVARYREELLRHVDRHEAMAVALRRAWPAIIACAATVVAGMFCLLVAETTHIAGLGPVVAIGIAAGLVATVTLLPALLVMGGWWIFWPTRPWDGATRSRPRSKSPVVTADFWSRKEYPEGLRAVKVSAAEDISRSGWSVST